MTNMTASTCYAANFKITFGAIQLCVVSLHDVCFASCFSFSTKLFSYFDFYRPIIAIFN